MAKRKKKDQRLCIHCLTRPRWFSSVYCIGCNNAGKVTTGRNAQRPWWTWTPYDGIDVEAYLSRVLLALAQEPDPELVLGGPPACRVNLPNRDSL